MGNERNCGNRVFMGIIYFGLLEGFGGAGGKLQIYSPRLLLGSFRTYISYTFGLFLQDSGNLSL
jgi:hypothetical protein